jgi:hypothetical protein
MNCPSCGDVARIAKSKFESPVDTTDVYSVMIMVCVNPDCANYETNLESPSKIVDTIRNKVN